MANCNRLLTCTGLPVRGFKSHRLRHFSKSVVLFKSLSGSHSLVSRMATIEYSYSDDAPVSLICCDDNSTIFVRHFLYRKDILIDVLSGLKAKNPPNDLKKFTIIIGVISSKRDCKTRSTRKSKSSYSMISFQF